MMRPVCLALAMLFSQAHAAEFDKQSNHYKVAIDAKAKRMHVSADVWVEGKELAMFGVDTSGTLKNGQADLVEKITVTDMAGKPIALKDKGEGEYEIDGDRRVKLEYDVKLEHEKYFWPGGNEEVLYFTDEGVMMTGYTAFIVPGEKMLGQTEVTFELPQGWKANTPWRGAGKPNTFITESRTELVNNAFFFGTARSESFTSGGVDVTLVMGKRYWKDRANFMEVFNKQLKTYLDMFGGPPLSKRYMIVINQGDTGDGGAFSGSFSQFMKGDADKTTRVLWGRVLAHELLHFWNGHTLRPAEGSEEWFKEGVTDYLTMMSMSRNKLMTREELMEQILNLPRGQVVARRLMGLKPTVREAVKEKHKNWLLVYGGGTLAALAMDVELRKASNDKVSLADLMKAMYKEFGQPGKTYTQADIVRIGKAVGNVDLGPTLEKIVGSTETPDLAPLFRDVGLKLEQWGMLETYLHADPKAPAAASRRFESIYGIKR